MPSPGVQMRDRQMGLCDFDPSYCGQLTARPRLSGGQQTGTTPIPVGRHEVGTRFSHSGRPRRATADRSLYATVTAAEILSTGPVVGCPGEAYPARLAVNALLWTRRTSSHPEDTAPPSTGPVGANPTQTVAPSRIPSTATHRGASQSVTARYRDSDSPTTKSKSQEPRFA